MAFNAKNLSYDAKEPAFLRKLRQEQAGLGPGDGRHAILAKRPRGKQLLDADDEPTYVSADSDLLSKEDVETLMAGNSSKYDKILHGKHEDIQDSTELVEGRSRKIHDDQKHVKVKEVASFNIQKKRKIGKMIGQSSETSLDDSRKPELAEPKKKKKNKTVALSFLDDAEKA